MTTFLGTELNVPEPVNNLTTLASDYNWVDEMALLTRFDPRNQVMKFGDQEWRRCGESATRHGRRRKEKEANEGKEEQVKSDVDEDRGVAVEVQAVDKVETVRPKRKQGGEQNTESRPQLRRPVLPLRGGGVNGKGTTSEVVHVAD